MTVNILAVGRLKEAYLRDAASEYLKRLGAYATVNIFELDEVRLSQKPSQSEITAALKAEADAFGKILAKNRGLVIAMCIEGKQYPSDELSKLIFDSASMGKSTVSFIIGSSFGLDEQLKKQCDIRLSMSAMTFPHQLARIMLLEQLYRAFQINAGGKYHK